jgi:3,4-dihydroxy 2-butanone 4-phosphate synthase/GTP cyclohydrolase II
LEKLRHLVRSHDLLLQEEARPLAIALFDEPALTVHLGFDQAKVASCGWYRESGHPYVQAILPILDNLASLPYVQKLEFLISSGSDPLSNLQVQLDRQTIAPNELPSSVGNDLETQKIYSFTKEVEE